MLSLGLLIVMALFLAYANGANDNFKGVATLYGGNVVSYKAAITLTTVATFAGAIASLFLAMGLVKAFSGNGVVPPQIAASHTFLTAVAAGAACTVMLATLTGFPVSTTHGLTGALVGAGLIAAGSELNFRTVGLTFFGPLLVSPVLALCLSAPLFLGFRALAARLAITKDTCLCFGSAQVTAAAPARGMRLSTGVEQFAIVLPADMPTPVLMGSRADCMALNKGSLLVAPVQKFMDYLHYVSGGSVCFARAVNDTPKMVALLVIVKAVDVSFHALAIAIVMAVGALISARRVAHTMSKRISTMDDGQALTANLTTAFLVIFASRLGLPVSTTHVSVGAISGVGLSAGTANPRVIYSILASWLLTLPIAAALGALAYLVLRTMA